MSPNLNPSRMPCFTQVFTRQPIGLEASGSAARTSPEESAARRRANAARAAARSADAPAATRDVISVSSISVTARASPTPLVVSLSNHERNRSSFEQAQDERVHSTVRRTTLVSRNSDSSHNSRAGHPSSTPTRLPRRGPRGWLRCSSLTCSRYARSSRLAIRAPRSGTYATNHCYGTLDERRFEQAQLFQHVQD